MESSSSRNAVASTGGVQSSSPLSSDIVSNISKVNGVTASCVSQLRAVNEALERCTVLSLSPHIPSIPPPFSCRVLEKHTSVDQLATVLVSTKHNVCRSTDT